MMTNLCIAIYRFFRQHRTCCWVSMVALFAFFGFFASKIHLEEDISRLMPASRNEDGSVKLAFENLRIKDKTFLLFEGKSPERLIEVCDSFVTFLEEDTVLVDDVFYRIPDELLGDAVDYLYEHLPSFIDPSLYPAIDSLLNEEAMARQMQQNYDDLASPLGDMYPELIEIDPIGLRNLLKDRLGGLMGSGSYNTVDSHFFVPDSTVCIAFITPHFSSTNTGQGSELFSKLNQRIAEFQKVAPDVKVSFHGTPAHGYYNARQIKHDLTTTIGCSLVLVLVLLLFCFRRWDTVPLLILPVAFGTLVGLTAMYFIRGEFSLLALGIGAVVLGVALSYVLHVLTHHQYVGDPEMVLRDEVKPLCLGCVTTIGSFAGLMFVETDLLRDFGIFAAFAILGTVAFSLVYLPQFLAVREKRKAFAWMERVNSWKGASNRWLLGGIALVAVVCAGAALVGGPRFDSDLHNLGYESPDVVYSEQLLSSKTFTGDKQRYFASIGKTEEEAIGNFALLTAKLDSLQRLGLVKGYTHNEQILVPEGTQQKRIDAWKQFWTEERLGRVRSLIQRTAPGAGLVPDSFDAFFEVARGDAEPDNICQAELIPRGFLSTLVEQSYNGDYLCFTSVRCADDTVRSEQSDYNRICDAVAADPHLLVLDTYYYMGDTLRQMSTDFNLLQWLSMLFVLVVLLFAFRFNLRHALLAFLPILVSWLIVLGLMAIVGEKFNLISIIISTFIFGIGVDYSIFVMSGLVDDGNKQLLAYHKTAVLLSAAILVLTVGAMLLATHPAIRSVGFTTLVGLLSAVILSYVVQPVLYRYLTKKKK